jgi:hypothetical protein
VNIVICGSFRKSGRSQRVVQYFHLSTFPHSFLILLLFIFSSTHFVFILICPLVFDSEGVLDFRISTYGLFTILHNTIIVDFPRCLVVTHSLLQYTRFGPSHAAPSDFQQHGLSGTLIGNNGLTTAFTVNAIESSKPGWGMRRKSNQHLSSSPILVPVPSSPHIN